MKRIIAATALVSLFACSTGGVAPATTSGETAPLKIDFGPLSSTYPTLTYAVPYAPNSQPIDYLQSATALTPPATYKCVPDVPKPCYETITGNCSVTEINGVTNQLINGRLYEWMWYIDGNIGALSPCIFSIYGSKNVITFKLTEAGPKTQ